MYFLLFHVLLNIKDDELLSAEQKSELTETVEYSVFLCELII